MLIRGITCSSRKKIFTAEFLFSSRNRDSLDRICAFCCHAMNANRIRKCQSLIFPGNNEPTTSLTIIDFRPSRLVMLNFSGNAWSGEDGRESKVWRRLGTRWEARVERFTDFLSRIPRRRNETQSAQSGKCSSDIVFPFRSTKALWSNFANATKSGRAPYLLSVAVILLGTFAFAERHSLNCRRGRRRRWGIFEQGAKKTYSFKFAV